MDLPSAVRRFRASLKPARNPPCGRGLVNRLKGAASDELENEKEEEDRSRAYLRRDEQPAVDPLNHGPVLVRLDRSQRRRLTWASRTSLRRASPGVTVCHRARSLKPSKRTPPAEVTEGVQETWSTRPDSNRRHPRWQRGALPTELLVLGIVNLAGPEGASSPPYPSLTRACAPSPGPPRPGGWRSSCRRRGGPGPRRGRSPRRRGR